MSVAVRPVVLSDLIVLPHQRVRTVALVTGAALLTAAAAQIKFHLGWTPVPISGLTLATLVSGAALGARMGAASQALYVVLGLFLPFYAGGKSGWTYATGATGGYLLGVIVAAYLVGLLAERMQDRSFLTALPATLFASVTVYLFGATWLSYRLHLSAAAAIEKGVAPFLVGDAFKSILAGALLPLIWKTMRKG